MWRSDEGVAPYGCLCQPKHTAKPKFENLIPPKKQGDGPKTVSLR